jgi:hypothetical protein
MNKLKWPTEVHGCPLLGRTRVCSKDEAIALWQRLSSRGFNTKLKDAWLSFTWLVDSPLMESGHDVSSQDRVASTVLPVIGVPLENCQPFLLYKEWHFYGGCSGSIPNEGWDARITALPERDGSTLFGFAILCDAATNKKPEIPKETAITYFQTAMTAIGGQNAVELKPSGINFEYRINKRDLGDMILKDYNDSPDTTGILSYPKATFKCRDSSKCYELLKIMNKLWPDGIRWCEMRKSTRSLEDWIKCCEWCAENHEGPWAQTFLSLSREAASPEAFAAGEGHDRAVQHCGIYYFKKSKKFGDFPAGLNGYQVSVDLFKEQKGWHFAFHLVEETPGYKKRRKATAALDAWLGGGVIERTPETMWPHLFPEEFNE